MYEMTDVLRCLVDAEEAPTYEMEAAYLEKAVEIIQRRLKALADAKDGSHA